MISFEQFYAIAYQRERVVGRRLALRLGIPLELALRQTLLASHPDCSLEQLLDMRQDELAARQTRRVERQQQRLQTRERKLAAAAPSSDSWQAWFDGACHPNPGKMGIGVLLRSPVGSETEISMMVGSGDSSEAEYRALIALLETANAEQVQKLVIYGDSRVVIDDVQNDETRGSQILQPLRDRAQRLLTTLPNVRWCWIPRKRNAAADALSQAAIHSSN